MQPNQNSPIGDKMQQTAQLHPLEGILEKASR